MRWFTDQPEAATGRYHALQYFGLPWYVKPDLAGRWGFTALRTRLWGGVLPGDEGDTYCPFGYRIAELGPAALRGKGQEEMEKTRAQLRAKTGASTTIKS